jgi:hypothetical protein
MTVSFTSAFAAVSARALGAGRGGTVAAEISVHPALRGYVLDDERAEPGTQKPCGASTVIEAVHPTRSSRNIGGNKVGFGYRPISGRY